MNSEFEKARADELEAVEEAIDAMSDAPDLDSLWEQQRVIRDRLLNALSTLIDDEEHDDWMDRSNAATRRREREL
ncbi:hypothetical protein HB13667_03980 [Pseudomonas putida]|uniref:Uncharacterized protein n=4 Tax=Pseudomonas TaxID=286 RepID=A0A0P7DHM0_PSEPU|nr:MULTISPECIES: hypothetical protein [Pseudomonas]ANY89599.1 hypothetical protein IEC33019_4089 [Pseudomonas putida]APO84584.1 hypothetical protein BL240_25330 [Pseudomonas putida]KPM67801.1 hypothetical protein HB13667_03980 [Pseudomonas putida]KWW19645.1 hypothetical protein AS889_25220 [Pseudomonas putida]MBA6110408.1 hypothetical protein [Pseudomonas asiatica]